MCLLSECSSEVENEALPLNFVDIGKELFLMCVDVLLEDVHLCTDQNHAEQCLTKISFSPLHVCACAFVCEMSSDGIPEFNFFDKMPSSSSQNKMSVFRHYAFRRHEHEQCEDQHNDQGMCV
jgi:hypothetical protein